MKSKPNKLKVPSFEPVRKYLDGEKADAETAAFGRVGLREDDATAFRVGRN